MTAEELLIHLRDAMDGVVESNADWDGLVKRIQGVIDAAVVAERQACAAAMCEACRLGVPYNQVTHCHEYRQDGQHCCYAVAIRARSMTR